MLFRLHEALSGDALYPLYLKFARLVADIPESLEAAQRIARHQGSHEKRFRHLAFTLRYMNTCTDWTTIEARVKRRAPDAADTEPIEGIYEKYAAENFEAFLVFQGTSSDRAKTIAQATCIQHVRYQPGCISVKIDSNDSFLDTPGYWILLSTMSGAI